MITLAAGIAIYLITRAVKAENAEGVGLILCISILADYYLIKHICDTIQAVFGQ